MRCFVNTFRLLTILIIPGISSLLNLEELANIQYAIDILDKPLLLNENEERDGVILSSRYGQLYHCQYEAVASGDGAGQDGEENDAKAEVVDLLRPMEDEPCLVQSTGWWTYELCYKKEIKQYHLEEGKISGDIISLGRYASEFNWNDVSLKLKPEYAGRYHSQEYTNGSLCDLTGELRSASIRFKCQNGAHDGIESVEEPTTCTYVVTVRTNKICQRPELKILSQKKSVPITCQPLLSKEEYSHYTEFHTQNAAKSVADSLPVLDRETTDHQPGTSLSRAESFFIMAETTDDAVDVGNSNEEIKRVLVGTIVKKLKKKLDIEKSEQEEEEDDETNEQKDKNLNTGSEVEGNQELSPNEKEQAEEGKDAAEKKASSKPGKQRTDASNELKSALEGILTAVNSELKTLTNNNDEDEDDEEEEEEEVDVVTQKKDAKQDSSIQKESENKEPDVSGGSSETEPTERKKVDETQSGEELTDTEVEGSYITWQGQGNQIQQITIDTGMKVRVKQVNKKDREQEEEEKPDATDSDPNELMRTKSTAAPARKVEVRIINAAYYNKDGKPVSVYADDTNPSIERMVIALLQRNDEEVSEFEKQKRIEENYRFKWSKAKEKKETKATAIDDQFD